MKKMILGGLGIYGGIYLVFVFINMEINPMDWNKDSRIIFVTYATGLFVGHFLAMSFKKK